MEQNDGEEAQGAIKERFVQRTTHNKLELWWEGGARSEWHEDMCKGKHTIDMHNGKMEEHGRSN